MQMIKTKTTTVITHRAPGFHNWPEAPDEVGYLSYPHRHMFMFVVGFAVRHDDREVEFHTAQSWLRDAIHDNVDYGARSCEMIAKDLARELVVAEHPHPTFVEVWEDGEHGARVDFEHVGPHR